MIQEVINRIETPIALTGALVNSINGKIGEVNIGFSDISGLVPSEKLPSYVDDVLEFGTTGDFPATGEQGKIYISLGGDKVNASYRWGGSNYFEISNPAAYQNVVYTTGNQSISGVKSFVDDVVFKDNLLYISQPSGFLTGVGFTGAYDGGYFLGKQSIFNSKIDLSSIGSNLTKSNSTRGKWLHLAISCDGKYQTAISEGYDIPIISNDYGKTWADSKGYIPNGGYSVAMSCDGKNQYTTSNGALYKSTNYGIDWRSTVNLPTNSAKYTATSADGKYVTIAIQDSFIRRSENYGITVETVGISSNWSSVAVSSDGRYQTAGNGGGGIYISKDYGKNWILAESIIAMPRFISMSADGKYQTAVTYLNKIYISKNYGLTWTPKESNRAWTCVVMSHDGKIQIATSTGDSLPGQGRLFVSVDYGENWIEKGAGPYLSAAISSDGKYLSVGMDSSSFFPFYGDIYTSIANEKIDGGFTADNIYGSNLIYNTGDQNISGLKNFYSRVTVSGTGVLLSGEAYPSNNPSGFITGVDLSNLYPRSNPSGFITGISNLVYTTGDQDINGIKNFYTRPTVNGTGLALQGEFQSNTILSGVVYSAQLNVKNDQGSTIYKGQPVYLKGAQGGNLLVALASNTGEMTSSKTLGLIVQNSVEQNAFGTVITDGILDSFDVESAQAGDPVWLGPSGNLLYGISNKPSAPDHLVYLGIVTRNGNNGEIFVRTQNGYELDELHDVKISSPQAGHFIVRNSENTFWVNSGYPYMGGVVSDINNISGATQITNLIQITQSGYDTLVSNNNVSASTLYTIVG